MESSSSMRSDPESLAAALARYTASLEGRFRQEEARRALLAEDPCAHVAQYEAHTERIARLRAAAAPAHLVGELATWRTGPPGAPGAGRRVRTPETPGCPPLLELLADRSAKRCRLVVLAGDVGTGKSLAACWWLSHQPGGAANLYTTADALASLNPMWSQDRGAWARAQLAPALVVDELGDEPGAARPKIARLLRGRYDAGRLTLCATNLMAKGLVLELPDADGRPQPPAYGKPLASRIMDGGGLLLAAEVLRAGEQLRQRAAAREAQPQPSTQQTQFAGLAGRR